MTDKIYEVCDTTSDEIYYPLAVFASKDDARVQILAASKLNCSLGDAMCDDDHQEITIFEREIGWSGHGVRVWSLQRIRTFAGADDYEGDWRTTLIENRL